MTRLPIPAGQPLVLFTDLDGTLIDHHSYSAAGTSHALCLLAQRGVPVIFCSSKTFAEQIHLQRELGLAQPFIIENGSAVAVPKGYFSAPPAAETIKIGIETDYDIFPLAHADAQAIRTELAHFQNIKGFAAASDTELAAATGLDGDALSRARDRQFTETIVTPLDASQVDFLRKHFAKKGFALSRGGRFHTVLSAQADKGKAVRWLANVFKKNLPFAPMLAATGDSPNDEPMLVAVDFPFLVQKHDGTWADVQAPGLIKIKGIGPAGFSAAVKTLLGTA